MANNLPWFLDYKRKPRGGTTPPAGAGGVSVPSWAPAPDGDNVNLPQSQPAQEFDIGPSKDLASAGSAGTAVKMPGPGAWDKTKPYATAALQGFQQGGVGGALGAVAARGIGRLIKGFADGGDLTPYIGKRVRLGERGPELVVDDEGNAQPVGLHGEEEGVPTRPAVVIPHESLSGEGLALVNQGQGQSPEAAQPNARVRELARGAATDYMSGAGQSGPGVGGAAPTQPPAQRPRRAVNLRPDEAARAVERLGQPNPNAPVDVEASPVMGARPSPRPTLPPAAVEAPGYDPSTTEMRPRWSSELNKETEHNLAERDAVAHPEERGGWKRILPLMVRGFLGGASRGGIGGGIGGAITGAVTGAVDSRASARAMHGASLARSDQRLAQLRGQRKEDLSAAQTEAQTSWYEQRPDIERQKTAATALQRERTNVLAQIRARKGSPFTPDDPLLAQAGKLGMHFDADSLNNAASNVVQVTIVDPDHPEQTRRAMLNKTTGELSDVAQSGYVQPVGPDGRTQSQRDSNDDRDRGFNALERQRQVTNELQRAGLNLSRERFDFTKLERDDRLSENTRKEVGAASKMRREAEQAQMDADSLRGSGMYKGDDGVERQSTRASMAWKKADAKAEALRREYFETYGYLHEPPEGGEMRMSLDEFRQLFPHAPNPMASAPSYGVVLTDSTQPGTPHTNTYPPRRGAPRTPSSAAPSSASPAQPKGRVSRANFGKVRSQNPQLQNASDAEVEAALRAQGIEVY